GLSGETHELEDAPLGVDQPPFTPPLTLAVQEHRSAMVGVTEHARPRSVAPSEVPLRRSQRGIAVGNSHQEPGLAPRQALGIRSHEHSSTVVSRSYPCLEAAAIVCTSPVTTS